MWNRDKHRYADSAAYSEIDFRKGNWGKVNVWTQRDQIQAYQFLRRRLVSALVAADANHPVSPNRRLVLGSILGVAAAVLITAVFGVLGVLNPSSTANWQAGGQVIIEQETGAR